MRVLIFAATVCLLALFGVTNSYPTEEVQPDVAEPIAIKVAAVAPEEEDATSLDENGRPKRQFVAGLITGALLSDGPRPRGYGYRYGRPHGYYGHHHHRPHYGGYGGYGGY